MFSERRFSSSHRAAVSAMLKTLASLTRRGPMSLVRFLGGFDIDPFLATMGLGPDEECHFKSVCLDFHPSASLMC